MTVSSRKTNLLALAFLIAVGGCSNWVSHPVPTPPAPMRTFHGTVRVTMTNRDTVSLTRVIVASDSLFGSRPYVELRVAVPLRQVAKIEEQVKSPTKTLILLGGIVLVLLFTGNLGS
jgi:hypothetical protein